jgi:hypothetical protein
MVDETKEEPLKIVALDKMGVLLTTAFGLVAALAWNGAIIAIFKEVFGEAETIVPMLIYAIVVTIVAVILIIALAKALSSAKKRI